LSSPLQESGYAKREHDVRFAPEVAKYLKSILPQQQFRQYARLLFRSVSHAACLQLLTHFW